MSTSRVTSPRASRSSRSLHARPAAWATLSAVAALLLAACAGQPAWHSGFENGFPGSEWLNHDRGAYSADGTLPVGRASAWTIVDRGSGAPVYSGHHAYKGWIARAAGDSHRAYPGILVDIPTPLVNSFMVYLDADYDRMRADDWIHFGTWGNHDTTAATGRWALHTLAVRDRKLEFAHTAPFHGEYIGPRPQSEFPLRRWVRLTAYIHYADTSGQVQVWQDGVPMLRAEVAALAGNPGTHLRTAHWGMYANGGVDHGVQYNDQISICTLAAPLTDLGGEPACP